MWEKGESDDVEKFGPGWDRDPNHLNTHLQIMWDDVYGEPEGLKSLDCTWKCSKSCFTCTLNGCYILMTMFTAPCFAFCAGINFACMAFQHIWANGPFLRICKINFSFIRKLMVVCMAATMAPLCETAGMFFSKAKVRTLKVHKEENDDDPDDVFIT
ncbi:caveolin-2 [Eurytemora carolleeae]|uniref:caveolin-2 n=1 Tax=Eurytemora carolleeae TaxID=1294199 RepID=UPI000C75C953|nr:caveolin-2 [Eurytemora carolleeae]|eukprot:XP_023342346.1 caveolin-2-like [Eurytemora affinis]